ncbi:MAG: acetyl-CoA carboxylase biotin carboxyl carrier protein [bacterium]|nr:acetyl-CoA carboxylase biotin carboxyl carrier protein [bacterium]
MDLNYLRKLLKIFDESTATELSIEEEGGTVTLSKAVMHQPMMQPPHMQMQMPYGYGQMQAPSNGPLPDAQPAPAAPAAPAAKEDPNADLHVVHSPIVGTFYRAASPDADAFIQVGQHVNVGDPLCIIEAMKLMNEIESDVTGTVVKIVAENAQPVEYNQPMFLIKPD